MKFLPALMLLAVATIHGEPAEPLDAKLMQMPAVSRDHLAFVYAGDIWLAPKRGGQATRLASPRGTEQFPRFSPDGSRLAFMGNYDGDSDLYVMPITGGDPVRITHHGADERLLGWYPDGQSLLFRSDQECWTTRTGQFFKVSASGGLPERLPVPYGEFGAISPDGRTLAYTPITIDFSTWKRYRGGMAADIWLFDLEARKAERIAPSPANDTQPMWSGTRVYFVSDRDSHSRDNLWCYDTATRALRQITHYTDFDVHFPSIGPDSLVYENGGRLFLLDLAGEQIQELEIRIVSDRTTSRPRTENVGALARHGAVGPTGKRAIFEARGDLFSLPAEAGVIKNLTETSGIAERFPSWSPDGKWLAYFSDRSGEYELTVRPADGSGDERTVTKLGPGFRYLPQWSPDSQKIVFIDSSMRIQIVEVATGKVETIGKQLWAYEEELKRFRANWSPDSRWIAYGGDQENQQTAIVLYDTETHRAHQVTSGFFDDDEPTFDPDGKYLYYRARRWFDAIYSEFDTTWIYGNGHALVCVPLRKDVPSPLLPKNDDESAPAKPTPAEKPAATPAAADKKPAPVQIELADFEARAVILPPTGGRFSDLAAVPGKLLFRRKSRTGSGGSQPISFYDLEKREEKQVLDDASSFSVSADQKKLLVSRGGTWGIISVAEGQKLSKPLPTSQLEADIHPAEEWKQLFTDTWRIQRDYFYDPGMHGVDWNQMRERYGRLISACNTRADVNYVLGELLGEMNSSHTYRSGGDLERVPSRPVGYLGCDFTLDQGAYRISSIPEVAPWEYSMRSPLKAPGIKIKVGDWLLAVNGKPLDVSKDPWAALVGLADRTVILTVNDKPTRDGAHEVVVNTIGSERWLRNYAWMESNRLLVDRLSGGRVGYLYVPDTTQEGQSQLYRQYRAQFNKPALLIDERWNSGGQIPDRFVELLGRRTLNYYGVRDGKDWRSPQLAHDGPKAILVNGWSGSGGDCFPYLFRETGLGPVIGTRTWGGLIGMTGAPSLIDGGNITVPTFAIYNKKSEWIIEGHGVEPDIEVLDDPTLLAAGRDPQLERAVEELTRSLDAKPVVQAAKPPYPKRVPRESD